MLVANLFAVGGVAAIVAGAWIVCPAAGLVSLGVAAILTGIGIVRVGT